MLARYRELLVNQAAGDDDPGFAPETISLLGAVPNYYNLYYYETAAMLRHQERTPTRASQVMAIEARLLERYADESLREKPEELMERGGAYYSESAAALMADVHADAGLACRWSTCATTARSRTSRTTSWSRCPRASGARARRPCRPGRCGPTSTRSCAPPRTTSCSRSRRRSRATARWRTLALVTNPLGPDASLAPRVWERLRSDNAGLFGKLDG